MADTISGYAPIGPMTEAEYRACNYYAKALMDVDVDGVSGALFHRWITAPGLAPGNSFKIRGRWLGDSADLRLAGYEFSINVPSNTVGNNALLVNGVPRATELGFLLMKCWLQDHGCTYQGLDALDLELVELLSTTNTFLHPQESQAHARQLRDDFITASEIRNIELPVADHSNIEKGQRPKAFSQGTTENRTGYLCERTHKIPAYVKNRRTPSTAVFSSEAIRHKVFDQAEACLRVEVETHEAWLKKNQLSRLEDWRLYGDDQAYRKVYALIREGLRLDEGLRSRKPKEEDIVKLAAVDQEILRWHLDDDDKHQGRNHPAILTKTSRLAQQQYFSDIKRRIEKKLRVDISVPWKKQAAAMSTGLDKRLIYPGMYCPPTELAEDVFCVTSVARMIHTLKVRLDRGRVRTIARMHIPPYMQDEPTIRLGHIKVSKLAREHLDLHRVPLHRYLSCHQWGVFGDVSCDEVLALARAVADFEPVRSRYLVGDKYVTVTTTHTPRDGSELIPTTSVFREDEH